MKYMDKWRALLKIFHFAVFLSCSAENKMNKTQGLGHAKHVFYHWATPPALNEATIYGKDCSKCFATLFDFHTITQVDWAMVTMYILKQTKSGTWHKLENQ
jgi:hypothetical protein